MQLNYHTETMGLFSRNQFRLEIQSIRYHLANSIMKTRKKRCFLSFELLNPKGSATCYIVEWAATVVKVGQSTTKYTASLIPY